MKDPEGGFGLARKPLQKDGMGPSRWEEASRRGSCTRRTASVAAPDGAGERTDSVRSVLARYGSSPFLVVCRQMYQPIADQKEGRNLLKQLPESFNRVIGAHMDGIFVVALSGDKLLGGEKTLQVEADSTVSGLRRYYGDADAFEVWETRSGEYSVLRRF